MRCLDQHAETRSAQRSLYRYSVREPSPLRRPLRNPSKSILFPKQEPALSVSNTPSTISAPVYLKPFVCWEVCSSPPLLLEIFSSLLNSALCSLEADSPRRASGTWQDRSVLWTCLFRAFAPIALQCPSSAHCRDAARCSAYQQPIRWCGGSHVDLLLHGIQTSTSPLC